MKRFLNLKYLPLFTLGAGGLGLVLRIWYFASRDSKGLLAASHFANTLCYLLFAAALAVIALCVRHGRLPKGCRYQQFFPGGTVPGIGYAAAAAGILITCISELADRLPMVGLCLVFGILAAVSLVLIGLLRFKRQRPGMYLYVLLALYLVVHVLLQVRQWNKETQLSVIFFPLLASLVLMVCTYLHAQLAVRQEGMRYFVFFQQTALLLCCLSINSDRPLFYLAMAAWLGCDTYVIPHRHSAGEEI